MTLTQCLAPARCGIRPLVLGLPILALAAAQAIAAARFANVPGVVIDHSPASSGLYIGSPSLAVLPNGNYVASHDFFGPNSTEFQSARTVIFRSADRGSNWIRAAEIQGAFWSSLFVHRGALYLLGPDRHHGNILIRRSTDGGHTWTAPTNSRSGLLRADGEYHCAPVPVLEHHGRLWRAFEWRNPPVAWGVNYRSGMLSVPVDADLLDASNWTSSNFLPSDRAWNGGDMGAWLEGNAVVSPAGQLVNILRVQTRSPDEKAAIVSLSPDGRTAAFDPARGFISFPGGAKKFTIRFDPVSRLYWSLATIVHQRHRAENPGGIRNTLALTASPDLTNWTVRCVLLYHPDVARHGFQYVDWLFDGPDLIAACRTAYDDGLGGARNNHDANFLTFHRFRNFRGLTMADSVPMPEIALRQYDLGALRLTGSGFDLAALAEGGKAFSNRDYVWRNLPPRLAGWTYTRTAGGERAVITVRASRPMEIWLATARSERSAPRGWQLVPETFQYSDRGQTTMALFRRTLDANQELSLPQENWTGSLLLIPPAE